MQLHLVDWGGEGTPLILLHGFGNDARIWDDFASACPGSLRPVCLDLRGHGDSDHSASGDYLLSAFRRDVEDLVAAMGFTDFVLMGHSLGGSVALRYAALNGGVRSLALVDVGPDPTGETSARVRSQINSLPTSFGNPAEYEGVLRHHYPLVGPESIARLARHALRSDAEGRFRLKLDPRLSAPPARSQDDAPPTQRTWDYLGQIRCPTLVVWARASAVLRKETAQRMANEALAHGSLSVVERAGHAVMLDNPEGFAAAVLPFLLEIPGAPEGKPVPSSQGGDERHA